MALLEQSSPSGGTRPKRHRPAQPMLYALAAYLLVRGSIMLNGYLYADDFAFRWWADTSSLTPEFLFRSYGGHVMPFGNFAGWVLQNLFPGSFVALMVVALIGQVATLALLWRIVLRLTGSNVAAFLAFMVPAFSMFTFEVWVWWCEIIETVPYGLFMMLAIAALIRALEGESGRWWLWSGLAFVGAALSISKGALGLIVLFAIVAALPIGVPRRRGILAAWRLNPRFWFVLGALSAAYVLYLQLFAPIAKDPDAQFGRAVRYGADLLVYNIGSGAFGGPWQWFSAPGETWNGVLTIPAENPLLGLVTVALVVALVLIVKRYRPNMLAYLGWVFFYALTITAVASYGRGGSLIASSGYRYTFDFWIPLALFSGFLFYAIKGEQEPFPQRTKELASGLAAKGYRRPTIAVLAAAAFCASCLISTVEPAARWVNSQTKDYVRTAAESMADIPEGAEFLPQKTMTDLVHPMLMLPFASTEVVFAPDPAFRPFVDYATDGLFGFTARGDAEQQFVAGTLSEPNGVCGYRVGAQPVSIPLVKEVPQWSFVAEVGYAAAADTTVRMTVGPTTHEVPIRQGLHNVYFQVEGPVQEVTAQATDPNVSVCIDKISIGPRLGPGTPEPLYPPPVLP